MNNVMLKEYGELKNLLTVFYEYENWEKVLKEAEEKTIDPLLLKIIICDTAKLRKSLERFETLLRNAQNADDDKEETRTAFSSTIKKPCYPAPSEWQTLDDKLNAFQILISLNGNMLVAYETADKYTIENLISVHAILQEKLEDEFSKLFEFIRTQGGANGR